MDTRTSLLEQNVFCLNSPSDDDLYQIYYIESKHLTNKCYRVIATAFGATSCSCDKQTKNPYQRCKHMEILDQILVSSTEQQQKIQKIEQVSLIYNRFQI